MEFNIKTINHKDEYIKYYNDFVSKRLLPVYLHIIIGGLFFCDALFLSVIFIWSKNTAIILNILLIYLVSIFFLFKNRKSGKKAEKYAERGLYLIRNIKEVNYIFTSEKITGLTEFGETIFLPEHIYEIDLADDYVAFKFFYGSLNFFCKNDFENEELWNDFKNLIKSDYSKIKRFYENKPFNKKHYIIASLIVLLLSAVIIGLQYYYIFF